MEQLSDYFYYIGPCMRREAVLFIEGVEDESNLVKLCVIIKVLKLIEKKAGNYSPSWIVHDNAIVILFLSL